MFGTSTSSTASPFGAAPTSLESASDATLNEANLRNRGVTFAANDRRTDRDADSEQCMLTTEEQQQIGSLLRHWERRIQVQTRSLQDLTAEALDVDKEIVDNAKKAQALRK